MTKLKPWAAGPFELIRHGDGHHKAGTDFDKRMALISYDNAIEVSITTFLQLHPTQRGGKTYERKKAEEWLTNYYKKLEFLEYFAKEGGIPLLVSIDEVIYYHNLRNELYHSGNGLVPESKHLDEARAAALFVFSCLFGQDAAPLLEAEQPKVSADGYSALTVKSTFLEAFIELEKTLRFVLHEMGVVATDDGVLPFARSWHVFEKSVGNIPTNYSDYVKRSRSIRNAIIHGQPTRIDEEQLAKLTKSLIGVTAFVAAHATSVDILADLRAHYPRWIRDDLKAVKIIQRSGRAFLEITISDARGPYRDEKVERMDLAFIVGDSEFSTDPMFPPARTAAENAKKFVDEMDPFSLIAVTKLFREDAWDEITDKYGPWKKGGKKFK